jgi:hypothetical protein
VRNLVTRYFQLLSRKFSCMIECGVQHFERLVNQSKLAVNLVEP